MASSATERRSEGFPGQRLVIIPPEIVASCSRQPVTRDLCLTHIGAFVAAGSHYVERKRGTAQHILIGCVSGHGECRIGGGDWRVGPGDLLFLPPGEAHRYFAKPSSPWTIFWVHFRGLRAADHLAVLGVSADQPKLAVNSPAVLTEAFEDIFRHTTHGYSEGAMVAMSTAFARLLGLVRVHPRVRGTRGSGAGDRLLAVLGMMRDQLERPWTLEELAASASLSVPHFTQRCRAQTGLPPMALLIRLRLQRAMDLLQQGSHNVAEAGRAVGYEDPFYFSRLFRKHMGMPPSSCRNGP